MQQPCSFSFQCLSNSSWFQSSNHPTLQINQLIQPIKQVNLFLSLPVKLFLLVQALVHDWRQHQVSHLSLREHYCYHDDTRCDDYADDDDAADDAVAADDADDVDVDDDNDDND